MKKCESCGCCFESRRRGRERDRARFCSHECQIRWLGFRRPADERFDSLWVGEPNSGCHLWMGALKASGHGVFRFPSGKTRGAHVYAWERVNGARPPGMQILHRCDVPACVNERHLYCGTHIDNMRDAQRAGKLGTWKRRPLGAKETKTTDWPR